MLNIPEVFFSRVSLDLELLQNTKLPQFLGSLFRGVFSWNFRNAMCITKLPVCETCELKKECLYYNQFDKELENKSLNFLQGIDKTPLPFVIHQTDTVKRNFARGERFEVRVTILGDNVHLLPYLVYAFSIIGESGITKENIKFKVSDVSSLDFNGKRTSIYTAKTGQVKEELIKINFDDFGGNNYAEFSKLVLNFHTPVKFQTVGNVTKNSQTIGLELLINSIIYRLYLISYFYCNQKDLNDLDVIDGAFPFSVISSSLKSVIVDPPSKKKQVKIDMNGMMGNLILRGNFKEMGMLLHIGSYVNIGKNTLFGNGGYTVNFK